MRCLLWRCSLREETLIVKISTISIASLIIAVTVAVCLRIVVIIGLAIPALSAATCTLVRRWTWRALILGIRWYTFILRIFWGQFILLLVEDFLIPLIHILLLVLRLVGWTWRLLINWRSSSLVFVAVVVSVKLWLSLIATRAIIWGVIRLLAIRVTTIVVAPSWTSILPNDSYLSRRWCLQRCLLL